MAYHATCIHAPAVSKMPQRSDITHYVRITHTPMSNGRYTAQVWVCTNHNCGYQKCRCNQGQEEPFDIIGEAQ